MYTSLSSSSISSSAPLTPWQSTKAVLKGIVSPLTDPFASPTKFCLAAGMIVAHAAVIAATGGAAAPILLALGGAIALYQTIKGGYELHKAKTPEERKKALTSLGAGMSNIFLLGFGAKPALKEGVAGGIKLSETIDPTNMDKMPLFKATLEALKRLPDSMRHSVEHLRSGHRISENSKEFANRQYEEVTSSLKNTGQTIRKIHEDNNGQWHLTAKDLVAHMFRSLSIASMLNLGS
jgi:hypothetical protein